MDRMSQLGGLLRRYSDAGGEPQQAPPTVADDFDQLAQAAPPAAVADGLAAACRSEQTPPLGQMAAQLFEQPDGRQRASILNTPLRTLGPTVLSQILARGGPVGVGLGGVLDGIPGGGQTQVTPEQAEQIPADAVCDIAERAEQRDPSVVDRLSDILSDIYSRHPTPIKTLGAAAPAIALSQLAKRQGRWRGGRKKERAAALLTRGGPRRVGGNLTASVPT